MEALEALEVSAGDADDEVIRSDGAAHTERAAGVGARGELGTLSTE